MLSNKNESVVRKILPNGTLDIINGARYYSKGDKLHRIGGPAVEYTNGDTFWYKDGLMHRVGGPATEDGSGKFYYQDGKPHRLDGPAMELTNGINLWWVNGKDYTKWAAIYIIATQYKPSAISILKLMSYV